MKKIMAILLVLAMVIAVAPAAFAARPTAIDEGTHESLKAGLYEFTPEQGGTLKWEIIECWFCQEDGNWVDHTRDLDGEDGYIANGLFEMEVFYEPIAAKSGEVLCDADFIEAIPFELKTDCEITLELTFVANDGGDEGGSDGDNDDYAEGSVFNPATIPGDNWNITLEAPYFYSYYAVEGGILNVTVSGMSGEDDSLTISDDNGARPDDNAVAWSADENGQYVVSAYVNADETVKICVNCWSGADVSISISFVPGEQEGGDDNDNNNGNDQGAQLPTVNPVEAPELADGLEWDVVDGADETIETAVLGEDGYYHLNSATGPVLFIDLQAAEDLDLVTAFRNNKDIYDAYKAAVPSGIFALDEQWIEILQDTNMVGAIAWSLWLDLPYEDTWMAMCVYSESITTIESEGDDAGDIDGSGDNGEIKDDVNVVPSTADNSAVMMSMIIMVMATAGAAVVLVNKKKFA